MARPGPPNKAELSHRLRHIRLQRVSSTGIRKLGYDPESRMAAVVFADGDVVYGYPNLTDIEIAGLLAVMEHHESLGHYISTVIKPHHDFEHVRWELGAAGTDH